MCRTWLMEMNTTVVLMTQLRNTRLNEPSVNNVFSHFYNVEEGIEIRSYLCFNKLARSTIRSISVNQLLAESLAWHSGLAYLLHRRLLRETRYVELCNRYYIE